jgi:hypothetical protein
MKVKINDLGENESFLEYPQKNTPQSIEGF